MCLSLCHPLLSDDSSSVRRFLSLRTFLPVSRRSGRHSAVRVCRGPVAVSLTCYTSAAELTLSSHTGVKRNKGKRENAGFPCDENSESVLRICTVFAVQQPWLSWYRLKSGFVLQNGKVLISPQSVPKFLFSCAYLFAFTDCCILHFGKDYIQT